MCRMIALTPLAVLLLSPAPASSEEPDRLADLLARQEVIHQAIERAEPSIACILVSRSDKYAAHAPALPREPGRLGRFDLHLPFRRSQEDNDPEYQALRRLDLSNPDNVPESYGSGVVLDEEKRLVLTLAHVVRKATKIYVRLPGNRGSWADIHASDPRSDLAVLRLIDHVPNLKATKIGNGSKLRKGDDILSLSNPFAAGFHDGSPSASRGIVSNLRRRITGALSDVPSVDRNARLPLYCFNTLIQTDTRMNLGCSGGALLNLQGELVGLISAKAGIAGGETPGGFAVPLDDGMRRIIAVLCRGEEVEYGFLGVYLKPPSQIPKGSVQIDGLVRGGPAAQAQLHGASQRGDIGDFILSINNTPIHSNDDLFLAVGMQLAGSTVHVEVAERLDGPSRQYSVKLAKFPSLEPFIASKRPAPRCGLRVDWTSVVLQQERRRRGIPDGVVIREGLEGSSAAATKVLHPDMIIKSVNRIPVTNPAAFYLEMDKAKGAVELTYGTLDRGGEGHVTINVK